MVYANEDKLLFLGNKNIPPVIYIDNDVPSGVAVDIVRELEKHLSHPVEIRAMDWVEAQSLVATGAADALIQINATEERKRIYDFSDSFLQSDFKIFTKDTRVDISSQLSLRGLKVGVEKGGLPQQVLLKDEQINLVIIPNFLEGYKLLLSGQIDAVVVDYRVGAYVVATNNLRGIRVVDNSIASSYSSLAVKKGNTALLNEINAALTIIKSDGTYEKILKKWQPKEVIFETQEQVQLRFYLTASIVLSFITLIVVIFMIISRRELLKRIKIEQEKNKVERFADNVIQSANVMIVCLDVDGKVVRFNKTAESVTGYNKDEILHKDWFEIVVPRDVYPETWKEFEKFKKLKQPIVDNFINPIRTKNGEEKIIEWRNSNLRDDNKITGTIAFGIDITERIANEKKLQDSEQKFSAAFHASPYLIAITRSKDGKIIDVNEGYTHLLGYSREESVGKTTKELSIWKDAVDRDRFVTSLKKDTYVYNFKTTLRRKDGSAVAVLDSAKLVKINDEDCILSIAIDMSKEFALEQSKKEFLDLASHHLRNIPTIIKWSTELLAPKIEKYLAGEDLRLWKNLNDASVKMIDLASAISMAAQIQTGSLSNIPAELDVVELVNEKLDEYQQTIKIKKLQIMRHYHNVNHVMLDKNLVGGVIRVLLSNAIRYTPENGNISITVSSVHQKLCIAVKDSGLGIPKDQQDKVFTTFFRADNVEKFDVAGVGLGLYTAKMILEQLQGKIWFESEEGKGTTFSVEIPC